MTDWLIVGIGNTDRGDDGVGRLVARTLAPKLPVDCVIREENGDAASLVLAVMGSEAVIFVDAVQTGATAGTVWVWDVSQNPLPVFSASASTHALGLATAIELARSMGTLPPKTLVIGVDGSDYAPGATLSPPVLAAIDVVLVKIGNLISGCSVTNSWTQMGASQTATHGTLNMHEMSLITDLLRKVNQVATENNAERIFGVTVQLGPLAHISAGHLREHFEEAVVGTNAEGARLEVVELNDTNHPLAQDIVLLSVDING